MIAALKPVSENVSKVVIANIARPNRPKSEGARRRARIIVRINPSPRFVNLSVKTQKLPLAILLEKDSDSSNFVLSVIGIEFLVYKHLWVTKDGFPGDMYRIDVYELADIQLRLLNYISPHSAAGRYRERS